jgi:hypothetical protein
LFVEQREMRIQRALPRPEDVGPLTANSLPDELAAMTGPSHDLLDRDSLDWPIGTPSHDPQQGIVADRQHQPLGKARSGSAAEREPEVVDDTLQALRSP